MQGIRSPLVISRRAFWCDQSLPTPSDPEGSSGRRLTGAILGCPFYSSPLTLFLPLPLNPYLLRTLDLARMAGSATRTNPLVGCVIVRDEKIIAEGFHGNFGGPHAEVVAISSVTQELLNNSELFVSLEPCNHSSKTPPCTEKIIASGIRKVTIGCKDPNPLVSGAGIQRLKEAGIEVIMVEDPTPFITLNKVFFINQTKKRPFITLKWAESADGFIGRVDEKGNKIRTEISDKDSVRFVHRLRANHQAVLVGAGTVLIDAPQLTTRFFPGADPQPLIWDPGRKIIPGSLSGNLSKAIFLHEIKAFETEIRELIHQGIASILVEGGTSCLNKFLELNLWDEIYRIVSPNLIGRGVPAPIPEPEIVMKKSALQGQDSLFFASKSG